MGLVGIHHVTLLVDDTDRAAWFYGEVLGLEEKGRPAFDFPGLFYWAGGGRQEVHLIVAAKQLKREQLIIRRANGEELSLRHVHRHAAFLCADVDEYEKRLTDYGIEVLFSKTISKQFNDELSHNMKDSWTMMYGAIPLFVKDPFDNLLELVPLKNISPANDVNS